jgi:hypothetical protein
VWKKDNETKGMNNIRNQETSKRKKDRKNNKLREQADIKRQRNRNNK